MSNKQTLKDNWLEGLNLSGSQADYLNSCLKQQEQDTIKKVIEIIKPRIMVNNVPDSDEVIGWNCAIKEIRTKLKHLLKE